MRRSILSVRDAGAAGASLCSGIGGAMYFGPVSPTQCRLGAWEPSVTDTDFSDPGVAYGRGRCVNVPVAEIRWPSLSGPGVKARWLAQFAHLGYSNEFNWFDPSRPSYVTTVAFNLVRRAFHEVDGQNGGPLRSWRAPELVVALPAAKAAGQIAWVGDEGAVVTPDGTAHFVLSEPGVYEVNCPAVGARTTVRVAAPRLEAKAGYGYLQWVALGGAKTEVLQQALARPVALELVNRVTHPDNRAAWDLEQERAITEGAPYAVRWGDTRLFEDGACTGLTPDWITYLTADGGRQDPRRLSYIIDAKADDYVGAVSISLDRKAIRGDVRIEVEAIDSGYVYVQLRGDDWRLICNNLTESSILGDTGARVTKSLVVPLSKYPDATLIRLCRYHGPVEIFRTTIERVP